LAILLGSHEVDRPIAVHISLVHGVPHPVTGTISQGPHHAVKAFLALIRPQEGSVGHPAKGKDIEITVAVHVGGGGLHEVGFTIPVLRLISEDMITIGVDFVLPPGDAAGLSIGRHKIHPPVSVDVNSVKTTHRTAEGREGRYRMASECQGLGLTVVLPPVNVSGPFLDREDIREAIVVHIGGFDVCHARDSQGETHVAGEAPVTVVEPQTKSFVSRRQGEKIDIPIVINISGADDLDGRRSCGDGVLDKCGSISLGVLPPVDVFQLGLNGQEIQVPIAVQVGNAGKIDVGCVNEILAIKDKQLAGCRRRLRRRKYVLTKDGQKYHWSYD
jgi:hypothetical protein